MESSSLPPSVLLSYEELQAWKYYFAATYVVLLYDWLITFDVELERIWKRQRNVFTILWVLIRYLPILMYTFAVYATFQTSWSENMCMQYHTLPTGFVITCVVVAHLIFTLRTYALYGRAKRILQLFIPLLLIELGVMIFTAFNETIVTLPPGQGCLPGSPNRISGILTWAVPCAFDCVVFGFTIVKTVSHIRNNVNAPVINVLLRDGVIYFVILLVAYLLNILLFSLGSPGIKDINAGFSAMITIIMTCRLILNLRAVAQTGRPSEIQTLRTAIAFGTPGSLITTIIDEIGYLESAASDDSMKLKPIQERTSSQASGPEPPPIAEPPGPEAV